MFLLRAQQPLAKGFGFGVAERGAAQGAELATQGTPLFLGALGPPRPGGKLAVSLAGIVDKALNVFAELAGGRVGGLAFEQSQFLFQFFGLGLDVGQTGLPVLGVNPFVGSVGVGDDRARKPPAQDTLGRLGGTVFVQVEESQVVIPGIPYPVIVAVMTPGRFVGMNHGQGADFLPQIFIERQAAAHGLALKTVGAGRHELQPEEIGEEAADFTVGHVQLLSQIGLGRLGRRTNIGTQQLTRTGPQDVAVAAPTIGLLVDITDGDGARLQNDVLLHMLMNLGHRLQICPMAVGATFGSRHRHDPVHVLGLWPLPRGMAHRSPALFAWGRGTVRGRDRANPAPLELAAMQGMELGLQVLVVQFQLLALPPLLTQLLAEFFQLIFVVAFRAGCLLIAMKDPAGGESFQIRAAIPVRATKVVGQALNSGIVSRVAARGADAS